MNVELRGICKRFGTVCANDGIGLVIPGGSIFGILGENGAGKSTLLKILSGFLRADAGEILLDGRPAAIRSPADGIRLGIGMLHQDPLDFPPMTILENYLLGRRGGVFLDERRAAADLQERARAFGFALDPVAYVDTLTVGERQQLEILRLLSLGVQVLILDEPTTGISDRQKARLFAALRRLASDGRTIVFVSHKLGDVEGLCGRIAVLRRGRLAGETAAPYQPDRLVEMMFGKAIPPTGRRPAPAGESVLKVENLSVEEGPITTRNISLDVGAGEVIGLAGVAGSGQELFLRACAGLVRPVGGHIRVGGADLAGRPYRRFLEQGVAYVPAARLEAGLVPGLSFAEHCALAGEQRGFFVDRRRVEFVARQRIEEFNIKAVPESPVESLSGGNQQRALLALPGERRSVLLVEHPTRGLDVESAQYIWEKLRGRCREGMCIVFATTDLEELLQYSDRVLVFFSGRVSPPLDAAAATTESIGRLIGGEGIEEATCAASART